MRFILISLIKIYQNTLGILKGDSCKFYPTCSEYARQAILRYGVLRGSLMSVRRILRCHPWQECQIDNP